MKTLQPKFSEFIPQILEEGVIHISMQYGTASHNCICGCGNRVVTPFSPTDWKLIFDGKTVTLDPSIGNWKFNCRSHYWIIKNEIHLAADWPDWKIKANQEKDIRQKAKHEKRNKRRNKSNNE
jgi:hypothetical protein